MTNNELSNEFDVLYNNITSNQAPGLDEYEKSVFLTKAQDEIVKSYFDPRLNKPQEGFDSSERRQIDFSMLINRVSYRKFILEIKKAPGLSIKITQREVEILSNLGFYLKKDADISDIHAKVSNPKNEGGNQLVSISVLPSDLDKFIQSFGFDKYYVETAQTDSTQYMIDPFREPIFDMRDNTKSAVLPENVLMIINEFVEVNRGDVNSRLEVVPINYMEYSRLMAKPFKRPVKNQAWRLINTDISRRSDIIIGPTDILTSYVVRYIRKPRPIILYTLDDNLSIGGLTEGGGPDDQGCELDPILHPEILQRAVELAKAAYTGDLNTQISLGQSSQTNLGMVTQSK